MAERRLLSTEGQHQVMQPKYEAVPGDVESESRSSNPTQAPYFPVRVVVYLAAYLIVGAVAYRHLEGINYLEGLYLSVITFTTVGFGDLAPKDDKGRVFTCFFIALALLGVAQLVDIVFDYLIAERKLVEKKAIFRSWFHEDEDEDNNNNSNNEDRLPSAMTDEDGGHRTKCLELLVECSAIGALVLQLQRQLHALRHICRRFVLLVRSRRL